MKVRAFDRSAQLGNVPRQHFPRRRREQLRFGVDRLANQIAPLSHFPVLAQQAIHRADVVAAWSGAEAATLRTETSRKPMSKAARAVAIGSAGPAVDPVMMPSACPGGGLR